MSENRTVITQQPSEKTKQPKAAQPLLPKPEAKRTCCHSCGDCCNEDGINCCGDMMRECCYFCGDCCQTFMDCYGDFCLAFLEFCCPCGETDGEGSDGGCDCGDSCDAD